MKAFLAPRGVVHWFLAGVSEQSHWLGTPNSGVPSDLEGGSIEAGIVIFPEAEKVPSGP